jgi:hypothetical protein
MVSAGASRADADVEASAALASDRRDHRAAAADARRRITRGGAALGARWARPEEAKDLQRRGRFFAHRFFAGWVPIFARRRLRPTYAFQSGFRAARRRPRVRSWLRHSTARASSAAASEDGEA